MMATLHPDRLHWTRFGHRLSVAALIVFVSGSAPFLTSTNAVAQKATVYEEIRRKSQIFEPKASFDPRPVTVTIVSVTYRIPRNYLTYIKPAIPTIKVTFPGFKPLSKETRNCFDPKWRMINKECTTFEFRLLGSHGPGPGGRALTHSERFENIRRANPTIVSRVGPIDYKIYAAGPESARIEFYRRTEGDIFFTCFPPDPNNDKDVGTVCDDTFRLDDGNHIQFFFRAHQVERIPEIERTMRRLMAKFVMQRANQ